MSIAFWASVASIFELGDISSCRAICFADIGFLAPANSLKMVNACGEIGGLAGVSTCLFGIGADFNRFLVKMSRPIKKKSGQSVEKFLISGVVNGAIMQLIIEDKP